MDAYGCQREQLKDVELIKNIMFLSRDMTGVCQRSEPNIAKIVQNSLDDEQEVKLAGTMYTPGEHITLHSFPDQGYLTLDIYASQGFIPKAITWEIEKAFKCKSHDQRTLKRGQRLKYPMARVNEDSVKEILESADWTYAKTMPEHPHHWICRDHWSDRDLFNQIAHFLHTYGKNEFFYHTPTTYWYSGDYKYWAMGNIINRAKTEESASILRTNS